MIRFAKRMLLTWNDYVENRTRNWKWNWKNANEIFWPAAWLAIVKSKSKRNTVNTLMQRNRTRFIFSIQRKRFVIHSLFSRETKALIDFDWTGFRKQWNSLLHVLATCNSEFGVFFFLVIFFRFFLSFPEQIDYNLCVFFIVRSLTS